jgi:hypothetical protein
MHESPYLLTAGWFTLGCILTKPVPIFTGKNFILHIIPEKLIIAKLDKNQFKKITNQMQQLSSLLS